MRVFMENEPMSVYLSDCMYIMFLKQNIRHLSRI
jgi:hypothetical protein